MSIMQASLSPSEVRQLVVEQFRQYGVDAERAEAPSETILIRDGRYRGRSYRADGLLAMWMIEIGLVQFYAEDGSMLATIRLFDRPSAQRAAA
jgi:hypothetical protein